MATKEEFSLGTLPKMALSQFEQINGGDMPSLLSLLDSEIDLPESFLEKNLDVLSLKHPAMLVRQLARALMKAREESRLAAPPALDENALRTEFLGVCQGLPLDFGFSSFEWFRLGYEQASKALATPSGGEGKSQRHTDLLPQEKLGERCADGGKCHHYCKEKCFRRDCCEPFSDYKGPWRYERDLDKR